MCSPRNSRKNARLGGREFRCVDDEVREGCVQICTLMQVPTPHEPVVRGLRLMDRWRIPGSRLMDIYCCSNNTHVLLPGGDAASSLLYKYPKYHRHPFERSKQKQRPPRYSDRGIPTNTLYTIFFPLVYPSSFPQCLARNASRSPDPHLLTAGKLNIDGQSSWYSCWRLSRQCLK
jgi:hypothetical protein